MKKLLQFTLFVCLMLVAIPVALANPNKETIVEGADLTTIHRIAIGSPFYTPLKDSPSREELMLYMYNARVATRTEILPYDGLVASMQKDSSIDLTAMDRREAAKAFKEHIASYADAYVIVTVANNSRTIFFFDLYRAGSNELLYTFQIAANSNEPDNEDTYTLLSEQFYKNFERAANKQLSSRK